MDIKQLISENLKWVHAILLDNRDFYDTPYHSFGIKAITSEMYARANWKPTMMRGYDSGWVFFKTEQPEVRIGLVVFTDTDFEEYVDFQLNQAEVGQFLEELDKVCINERGMEFEKLIRSGVFKR